MECESGGLERALALTPPEVLATYRPCAPTLLLVAPFTHCLVSLRNNLQNSPLWYLQVPTRRESLPTLTSNPGPRINHGDGDATRPAGQSERRNQLTG